MTEEKELAVETNGEDKKENENDALDATELESAIIRQVEYYFGDVNMVRDKFLREQVKLDDGWIPLEVLTRFHRLAAMTMDTDVIAKALNKSTSGLLEVSEDNKKLRRSPEMPLPEMNEERRKELQGRTIYAKGFPKDIVLDELLKFFGEHGEVENIIMRRYLEKSTRKRPFKGSVFTTFKVKEQAQKFMEKKGVKYGETELIVLWQENYLVKKQEEYAEKKVKKEKKIKDKEAKEEKEDFKLPKGTVFHFSEAQDTTKREDIKEALGALGAEIAFIDFKVGDTEGWVRLTKENSVKELAEKFTDNKLKIGENDVVFRILEGDEEKAYLEKTIEEMAKRRKHQKSFGKHNKGRNFKGKGHRKRKQEDHDEEPKSKVKAS